MYKNWLIVLIFLVTANLISAQDKSEIWYVWIDTETLMDGKPKRIVSEELMEITCCVKSPKYRRFSKKAGKWLKDEHNSVSEDPFKKLQDKELAVKMITEAKNEPGVMIVRYNESCK
jgi:hypothetical protein